MPPPPITREAGFGANGEIGGEWRCSLYAAERLRAIASELLVAIQGSRLALEGKIETVETVAMEVNLLRADLQKVSDKLKVAEGSIAELQSEVGTLRT
ncbi:hypothetical protein NDU88_003606 [Pleurodeles waltl]|uniref:Uncharacterized protein n=1 Tax=Pleurodeles waltl TaxID=8319 RepID=A0AAV7VDS4_PLEWA|nr:hypothetical protein NDU88_003606 [Pleurodeles waltl]